MNLLGTIKVGKDERYLFINDTKTKTSYYVYNKYHKDDSVAMLNGQPPLHTVILDPGTITSVSDPLGYLCEGLTKTRVTNVVNSCGGSNLIEKIISLITYARNYKFNQSDVKEDSEDSVEGVLTTAFFAKDNNLEFSFVKEGLYFSKIFVRHKDVLIDLNEHRMKNVFKGAVFTAETSYVQRKIAVATMPQITYKMLQDSLDMSWFEKDGVRKKDYRSISTIEEFETLIMEPLAQAVEDAERNGTVVDLAIDTETTGLHIFRLAEDNPVRDHCVAIPICWEDDKAFVIFTDMEYFMSVDNKYVMKRLFPFLCKDKGSKHKVQLRNGKEVRFHRSTINLIGHNVMFDGKVFYSEGYRIWWNNDTLQMCFNLDPDGKSRKLKMITRQLFNHETPELEDVAGKGNEDKYKYLSDRLVAEIYGCADADYTRKVFRTVKTIMPNTMYAQYQHQDIPLLNILFISEFNGLQTIYNKLLDLIHESENNLNKLKEFMYQYVGKVLYLKRESEKLNARRKAHEIGDVEYSLALDSLTQSIPKDEKYVFETKASDFIDVMYYKLKYKIPDYTDTGQPKVDKKAMKKLLREKLKDGEKPPTGIVITEPLLHAGYTMEDYEKAKASKNKKYMDEVALIDPDVFNKLRNPLALVLQKWGELNKEYTAYFKPILEQNLEEKIFKGYNLARIKTRRISNPAQTMKGNLKALIRSYNDDYYVCDFDMSQVEYRIMASLSGLQSIIQKMRNPEKDYHIETASLVHGIPAYRIDKKTRKGVKCIGFGVPYGLSEMSLCENLFGEVNDMTLSQTRLLRAKWDSMNQPICEWLDAIRDKALVPEEIPLDLRNFMDAWQYEDVFNDTTGKVEKKYKLDENGERIPKPIGFVRNEYGFYRTFDLTNVDKKSVSSSIRRRAGNYPIQSYAAELFREILIRFYNECCKEGIEDKIMWHMLIHDELLCSVHKSIHPFQLYKIIKRACMFTRKGHTNYFVGINIGNTWAETKDDAREAPILFVQRMIKRWDAGEFTPENTPKEFLKNGDTKQGYWFDNPWDFIKPYRERYVSDRIFEVIVHGDKDYTPAQADMETAPVNVPVILENFKNYTVRSYVEDYPSNYSVKKLSDSELDALDQEEKDYYFNELWVAKLESWVLERFGEGKAMINQKGEAYMVYKNRTPVKEEKAFVTNSMLFDDDNFEQGSWSLNYSVSADGDFLDDYLEDFDDNDDFEEDDDYVQLDTLVDFKKDAKSLSGMLKSSMTFKNIIKTKDHVFIKVPSIATADKLKKMLQPSNTGLSVLFQGPYSSQNFGKVKSNFDFTEIDEAITREKESISKQPLVHGRGATSLSAFLKAKS